MPMAYSLLLRLSQLPLASRPQPSSLSLSLINQSSLCSLVSRVDFKIFLFYFETNKSFTSKSFFTPTDQTLIAGCCYRRLTFFPPCVFSASQPRLPSLKSGKFSSFFIPLFPSLGFSFLFILFK